MEKRKNKVSGRDLRQRVHPFGLAALLATSLLYVPSFAFAVTFGSAAQFASVMSFAGYGAMVAIGAFAALTLGRRKLDGSLLRIAGSLCYIASALGFALATTQADLLPVLPVAIGVLHAVGAFSLYLRWGLFYRNLGLRASFFYIALSVGGAILIGFALTHMAPEASLAAFVALAVLASLPPSSDPATRFELKDAPGIGRSAENDPDAGNDPAAEGSRADGGRDALSAMRTATRDIHAPIYGLIVLAFTDSILGIDMLARINRPIEVAGFCLATIIFLALCAQRFDKPMLPFVYRVLMPVMVLMMFAARMISAEGGLPREVFDVLFFALYGSVTILAFTHIAAILRADELPCLWVAAAVFASYGAAALVGMAFWELVKTWGPDAHVVMLITWIIYFAYLALSPAIEQWLRLLKDREATQQPLSPTPPMAAADWARFSEIHGLSQRESEIMEYLGRGHSSTFISQTLVISDNTVRTHTRHIYRKVGVASRDELLKAVSDFQNGCSGNAEELAQTAKPSRDRT